MDRKQQVESADRCNHYFEHGYSIEPCIYGIKCDKELFQLGYTLEQELNLDCKNGKLIEKW